MSFQDPITEAPYYNDPYANREVSPIVNSELDSTFTPEVLHNTSPTRIGGAIVNFIHKLPRILSHNSIQPSNEEFQAQEVSDTIEIMTTEFINGVKIATVIEIPNYERGKDYSVLSHLPLHSKTGQALFDSLFENKTTYDKILFDVNQFKVQNGENTRPQVIIGINGEINVYSE